MYKYFIVSDIHSYYSIMIKALENKGFDITNKEHIVILCGDAFDRGYEAVEMFNFLKEMQSQSRLIYICGNHEDLLFDCVNELKETGGCASSHHHSNGTVGTVEQFLNAKILDEVLDFIDTYAIDYLEMGNYIFCHGWIPTKYDEDLNIQLDKNALPIEWKKARWLNGMSEWHKGNYIEGKTIVCGHWHSSFGNFNYHHKGSGEFIEGADFDPFIDKGIIALDSCTAYTHKVNVILLEGEAINGQRI